MIYVGLYKIGTMIGWLKNELWQMNSWLGKLLPTEVLSASYQVRYEFCFLLGWNSVTSRDLPTSFPIDKDDLKLSLLMAVFQVAKTTIIHWSIITKPLSQSEAETKASFWKPVEIPWLYTRAWLV